MSLLSEHSFYGMVHSMPSYSEPPRFASWLATTALDVKDSSLLGHTIFLDHLAVGEAWNSVSVLTSLHAVYQAACNLESSHGILGSTGLRYRCRAERSYLFVIAFAPWCRF
jgi:hypothetical protein